MRTLNRSLTAFAALALAATPFTLRAERQEPAGFPKIGATPIVTMVSTGGAPKAALRYKLKAGDKSQMLMTMAMGTTVSMGGTPMMSMDLPVMKMAADINVTSVSPAGDATYQLAFSEASVEPVAGTDPAMAEMMRGSLGAVKGMKGSATISPRGLVSNAKFDLAGLDPALAQAISQVSSTLESMSMPMPEEAVGPGAKWEVRQAINSGGAIVYQKTEVELVSVDAGVATMKLTLSQTAPRQAINPPGLPAGISVTVESWTGTGTGTAKMRFDSLVPTSETTLNANATMSMDMGGNAQTMGTEIRAKTTITPGTVK